MFCSSCGKEIPDSAKFCPMCGESFLNDAAPVQPAAPEQPAAPVEPVQPAAPVQPVMPVMPVEPAPAQPVQSAQPEQLPFVPPVQPAQNAAQPQSAAANPLPDIVKKFDFSALVKNKNVLIGAAAVVAVLLLIIIISIIASSGGTSSAFTIVTKGYYTFTEDDTLYVFYGAQQLDAIDCDGVATKATSADGSKMALYTYDKEMYYFNGTKCEELGEIKNLQLMRISDDGSTVAYVTYDDGTYTFSVYANSKTSEICEYENSYTYDSFVMSPDGSVILYTIYEDGDNVLYAYNGKSIELGKDLSAVAVSNGGKIAYVYDDDNSKLCYIKNLDKSKKETIDNEYRYVLATTTGSDAILYKNDDGHTMMFSADVKKPVLVEKNTIELIFPTNAVEKVDSFDNFLAEDGGTIRRYVRKGDEYKDDSKILSDSKYSMYMLSSDGKTIVFSDGDELCSIETKVGAKATVLYEDMGSYYFFADHTLSHIYFMDNDDRLCHSNGSKNNCKVVLDEDDAEDIEDGEVTASGVFVLLDDDDTLYYIDGSSLKEIKKPSEVDSIIDVEGSTVFVLADDEVWVSADGKSYTNTNIER